MTTSRETKLRRRPPDEGAKVSLAHFYAGALTEAERLVYEVALEVDGLDQEIATLRTRLRTAIKERPAELALMFHGIGLLARLVGKRYALPASSVDELAAAMRHALLDAGNNSDATATTPAAIAVSVVGEVPND